MVGAASVDVIASERRVCLACELPTNYPGERMFAPDIFAVVDVERRERERWVVGEEARGSTWRSTSSSRGASAKIFAPTLFDKQGSVS